MADTATRNPIKRKSPGFKPGSAKKPKFDNATPKKQNFTPKVKQEKFTPKVKQENASPKKPFTPKVKQENASPKKPFVPKVKQENAGAVGKPHYKGKPKPGQAKKPFAGTKNIQKQVPNNAKKEADNAETTPKKKSRRSIFGGLKTKLTDPGSNKKELVDLLEGKIQEIKDRGELSKTAKKKIRMFAKFILIAKGEEVPTKAEKAPKVAAKKPVQNGKAAKVQKIIKKEEVEEDDDDDEEDDEVSGEEEEDEESGEEEEVSGEEEEDDDDEDEDDIFEESDEEQKKPPKAPRPDKAKPKPPRRYICFVGNLSYDTTIPELTEHFQKCGLVKHVRIPLQKNSNISSGFGFVELSDHETYEKCLSLHHTFLKGRRINVLYADSQKRGKEGAQKGTKAKELKLNALRRQGKLHGSKKLEQRRSFRRNKQKQQNIED